MEVDIGAPQIRLRTRYDSLPNAVSGAKATSSFVVPSRARTDPTSFEHFVSANAENERTQQGSTSSVLERMRKWLQRRGSGRRRLRNQRSRFEASGTDDASQETSEDALRVELENLRQRSQEKSETIEKIRARADASAQRNGAVIDECCQSCEILQSRARTLGVALLHEGLQPAQVTDRIAAYLQDIAELQQKLTSARETLANREGLSSDDEGSSADGDNASESQNDEEAHSETGRLEARLRRLESQLQEHQDAVSSIQIGLSHQGIPGRESGTQTCSENAAATESTAPNGDPPWDPWLKIREEIATVYEAQARLQSQLHNIQDAQVAAAQATRRSLTALHRSVASIQTVLATDDDFAESDAMWPDDLRLPNATAPKFLRVPSENCACRGLGSRTPPRRDRSR